MSAFEQLYDRYDRFVLRIAFRICRDPYVAEDVHQAVFLKLWRSRGQYRPGCFAAWLRRVTQNESIDAIRRRPPVADQPIESYPVSTSRDAVFERFERSSMQAALIHAMAQLRREERTLIQLGFFLGLTHVEIADRVGVPLGTVKTRIRTALRRLRALLWAGSEIREAV